MKTTVGELSRIMKYGLCHEDVTRDGESQPCEATAVAVRVDPEDDEPYPVCARHARADMVPLTDLGAVLGGDL